MPSPPFDPIRRIVIVGGGTAGWMTAAALSRCSSANRRIVLIESNMIGTVGVGEATIPPIIEFNRWLGIEEADFFRETGGTIKLGIEFVGWGKEGERYFHPFETLPRAAFGTDLHQVWLKFHETKGLGPLDEYFAAAAVSKAGRVVHPSLELDELLSNVGYAYHFDAGRYAAFLRRYAEARDVERIEGMVGAVERDMSGYVTALNLDGERRIRGDLFIDCTGFKSLLLGAELKVPFEDWSHWLPCDRAIAIPSVNTESLRPYTRATAQEAGWTWQIPLQHRVGNGHVYSGEYISDDAAEHSLRAVINGSAVGPANKLRFTAGRRKRFWDANVIAIGLAGGFLEPLESTSIHLIQYGIRQLVALFPDRSISDRTRREYNRLMQVAYDAIRDFIILHYHANRRDGDFWAYLRNMTLPSSLQERLDLFSEHGRINRWNDELFDVPSWIAVLIGQGVMPRGYDPFVDDLPGPELLRSLSTRFDGLAAATGTLPSMRRFLIEFNAEGR